MKLPCVFTVIGIFAAINHVGAFTTTISASRGATFLHMTEVNNEVAMDRRAAILRTLTLASATLPVLGNVSPAYAKKKEREPITAENVSSAFSAVRYELESPEGGVAALKALVEAEDFTAVMDFSRDYDLEFRKLKMGRARRLLSDVSLKDEAILKCNAVTFDLIGVNRSSRKGQENRDEALKYVGEMKKDIATFLEYEKNIVIPAEEVL
mmetsp:Transcript_9779/g.9436  ORF Transcript_9779/g.9436 Transcript_9779/m.9436 type:complete len:210 (-) Transcript_9779:213-842(-)|eukprot:CAMPEP_0197828692 /NCGR_PEP_ID=MMETSP1437-20131217/5225_1 /TAXON_ID=49252 ORGANISM="Eucampia antarctica, Strain CCMP1452" /NCGR_SAMPLE_ID=MMETSP1437 /ASSEMBLY_ACC=CAM_ASM_001096 /LENGTH=209 /DNA_ID=CAMNT_0043430011 /DNA_START=130 /DNA_END=759 /DNA_ORIENTATION=+